jgi:hypothetical protein
MEDIVDEAGPDGPGASPFIDSNLNSVNDPALGGAWAWLNTSDISSKIDGSSCMMSVHPLAVSPAWDTDSEQGFIQAPTGLREGKREGREGEAS